MIMIIITNNNNNDVLGTCRTSLIHTQDTSHELPVPNVEMTIQVSATSQQE